MAYGDAEKVKKLGEELSYGDVATKARAAEELSIITSRADADVSDWIITVYDKLWRPIGCIGDDLMELTGNEPRNDVPAGIMKIKGSSVMTRHFRSCKDTMVGVTVETSGLRFAFYVDEFDEEYKDGAWTGTVIMKGIWDVLNYLQIWPMWYFPIQAQPISHAVYIWALCTVIESMIAENSLRIQSGLWEFINNALSLNPDFRAWFGTMLLSNGNMFSMLQTPIYVVRTNPLFDSSPFVARTVRMESCGAVIKDISRPYGVDVTVELWLPGDPQPDLWAQLTLPTYVVKVTDRSQIEGPTKSVVDSVIRTLVDIGGSFGDLFAPLVQNVPGMDGVVEAPGLGINYIPPWTILVAPDEGKDGAVTECKISHHTPKGWQHIIGGRCVSGDTPVHTEFGLMEASKLAGQRVMTLSEGGVYREAVWRSYGKQQLWRVTFANDEAIMATANHRWVFNSEQSEVFSFEQAEWATTLDLVGKRIPHATLGSVEVVSVQETDRIETVYCCEEPITGTWVAGSGFLTGNSPKWLNDLMNATFAWIIDSISIIIGFTGIPSDLLSGFMNNAFLAFQLIELYSRRSDVGPYHPAIEVFHPTSSAPYNIETLFAFINAFWDSRGYTSAQATFRNGEVYTYGKDIFKGALVSILFDGRTKLYTDYVENVMFRITPDIRDIMVQIGDGKAQESPLAKHQRFVTGLFEAVSVLTLAPQG